MKNLTTNKQAFSAKEFSWITFVKDITSETSEDKCIERNSCIYFKSAMVIRKEVNSNWYFRKKYID